MENTALLLIDIQNMYFKEGCCRLENPERAGENAGKLLKAFRSKGMPVVHIKHKFDTTGCPFDGDYLRDINECVYPYEGETVIEKTRPSSFYHTPLKETLEKLGVKTLVVAGMMSHMCVDTTVRAASNIDYGVILAGDACADKAVSFFGKEVSASETHAAFMGSLGEAFAKLSTTDAIILEL